MVARAAVYYVSNAGSDTAAGSATAPFATPTRANSVMVAGDRMIVGPGSYSIGSAMTVVAGTAGGNVTGYIGIPCMAGYACTQANSTVFTGASTADFFIAGSGQHDFYITGFTFQGTGAATQCTNAGIFLAGANNVATSSNIMIYENRFVNFGGTCPAIVGYQMDNLTINRNVFDIGYQAISLHNNDAATVHNNVSLSYNSCRGQSRYCIEAQNGFGYQHLHVVGNDCVDYTGAENTCLSIVDNGYATDGVTEALISENTVVGGAGIEVGYPGALVTGNHCRFALQCFLISHGPNMVFQANYIDDTAMPFGQDGGYDGGQYVGMNWVNGVATFGWVETPGGTAQVNANNTNITPPCAVQTQGQALAALSSGGGTVTPPPGALAALACALSASAMLLPPNYPQ